jgi:CelD/BcsL family acetyltransferase involved in cellulose biosynthesis
VATELPQLIESLHAQLGEIIDICINWSVTEAPLELYEIAAIARTMRVDKRRRQRLMVVTGRQGCANILVVPHMTSQALGVMVMRCAGARPVSHSERETQLFEIAECVMQAAQIESASWAIRRLDDVAPSQKV